MTRSVATQANESFQTSFFIYNIICELSLSSKRSRASVQAKFCVSRASEDFCSRPNSRAARIFRSSPESTHRNFARTGTLATQANVSLTISFFVWQ